MHDDKPERDERSLAPAEQLAALRTELQRLRDERDRAVSARDAVIRQALVASDKPSPTPTSMRVPRQLAVVALLILLGGAAAWLFQLYRTNQQLRIRQHSQPASGPPKSAATATSGPTRSVPVHGRTRVTLIPVQKLNLLGRAALEPGERHVAVAGGDGWIAVLDLTADRAPLLIRAHTSAVRDLVFPRTGQLLSGGADGAIHLWEIPSGRRLKTIRRGKTPVRGLAVANDLLAVAAEDPTVELWSLSRPGAVQRLSGHSGWVRAVAWSPDGKRLASGGHDGLVRIWSGEDWATTQTLSGHGLWISALAFSPDGKQLASAGFDKRIRLWDISQGKVIHRLWGHVRQPVDLAFDPTGQYLASASLDRTALIWNVAQGRVETRLEGHRYQVSSVAFLASGRQVLTSSTDGTLGFWPLPLPLPAIMLPLPPPGPGEITLRNNTTGERMRIRLKGESGELLESGRKQLAQMLRSGPDDLVGLPDPKLVKLLYQVADHFGRHREVIVISGYRSPQYNALRTRQSRQVGERSLHLKGQAIDLRIQHVTITALHAYAKQLKAGGVGFYPDSQFVHIDVGPVRTWEGN